MSFDNFFLEVGQTELVIHVDKLPNREKHLLDNEALFQLPLISLIILLLAKDRRKPFVSEIGQLVGESIENGLAGFKGSSQHLGWSANLRVRTVKALGFLEYSELIEIENRKGRIKITDLGRKIISSILIKENDLSINLLRISRSYRNICVAKKLKLVLE